MLLSVVVDSPSTATFLTPQERAYLVWRKSVLSQFLRTDMGWRALEYDNSTVGEEEDFAIRHVIAAFTDWQVYLHLLVYMSIIGPRASPFYSS